MVTTTLASPDQKLPSLMAAIAVTRCELASRMLVSRVGFAPARGDT